MPVDLNAPLDITKTQVQILMEQINVENNTELLASDFTFSAPEVATILFSDANTKVKLTPKVTSLYYGSRDIFYKRMDISKILSNENVEIIPTPAQTLLSHLIPQINSAFGINLTADDYNDTTLPVVNPVNPDAVLSVVVNIKPTSYLFFGTTNLVIGAKIRPVDEVGVSRDIYVVSTEGANTVYTNTLKVFDTVYNNSQTFQLFRNCFDVTKFRIDNVIVLSNTDICLRGEFGFDAAIGTAPLQTYDVTSVIVSALGNVKAASVPYLFGDQTFNKYFTHKVIDKVYTIDTADIIGTNASKVYRYNNDGSLDTAFNMPSLSYVPTTIAIAQDGKIYTASPELTGPPPATPTTPTNHVRIDRFLPSGLIDPTFNAITITSTGSSAVTPVVAIKPITLLGIWVLLKPINGVSTAGNAPVVNLLPLVPGSTANDGSFNPVLRFNIDGAYNSQFKPLLLNNEPTSVFIDSVETVAGDSILNGTNAVVSYVTNHVNSVNGYTYRELISYDSAGKQISNITALNTGELKWDTLQQVVNLSNGNNIVRGIGRKRLTTGGWSNPIPTVAIYNKESQLLRTIYAPLSSGTPFVISKIAVNEMESS